MKSQIYRIIPHNAYNMIKKKNLIFKVHFPGKQTKIQATTFPLQNTETPGQKCFLYHPVSASTVFSSRNRTHRLNNHYL